MEDKGYIVLSTLIHLKCFKKDDVIFNKGTPSEYSYIVLRGLVKVSSDDNVDKCT
jgi:signal-transduction protein with cAMP-binding, CBS, and nucleotidyltransferase domain